MNVSLTPTLEAFVREKVASGLYNNASEVVREALRRWIELEPPRTATEPASEATTTRARLERLAPRLRALGVERAVLVGAAARGQLSNDGEVELLLDVDPKARFTLVDLASSKSLCEGLLGLPVKVMTSGGLDAATRRALLADGLVVF